MRKIEFREFMKWAFGEELVHVATGGDGSLAWSRLAEMAALGTMVDTFGLGGAGLPELANVHPDALAANDAVMLLAAEKFSLPDGWNPFPDMDDPHGLIALCVAEVLERRALRYSGDLNNNLIAMVISYAVMGREPDWTAEQPKFRMIEHAGKPAWFVTAKAKDGFGRTYTYETNGYIAKSGRPKQGAYRKYEMSVEFQGAVQARIDWYLWSNAIEIVFGRLSTGLKDHQITMPAIDCEIWKKTSDFSRSEQGIEIAAE